MFIKKSASSKKISESFARVIWGKFRNFKKPFFKALENRCLFIFKGATKMYFTHVILAWSLFCLIRVYVGLHFLQFLL